MSMQPAIFAPPVHYKNFPTTRYQGSKYKLLEWIWSEVENISFNSAVDLFGGTGAVSYLFKTKGKKVVYNDNLRMNWMIGKALIENSKIDLAPEEISKLFVRERNTQYDDFIERTYAGVYFLDDENRWLDTVAQNIAKIDQPYKKAIAYFALFQACLRKRPYNLFHRANLYMRTADVGRSFGNKATWETPFKDHFYKTVKEANRAIFNNGRKNEAILADAMDVGSKADLVYIDPPYMNAKGQGVDYLNFYHFLEGLTEYEAWPSKITCAYKHKPYVKANSPWINKKKIQRTFNDIIEKFSDSILVVSYRDDGVPSAEEIAAMLKAHKRKVYKATPMSYQYALSKRQSNELLFIAE